MKTSIIMLLVLMFSLISCKGKEGSREPDELSSKFFEGSGKWKLSYYDNSVLTEEELIFTGDECQYKKTIYMGGYPSEMFNKRLDLMPVGQSRLIGTNLSDTSEQWAWSYSFPGTQLRLCDAESNCYDFNKI